MKKKLTISFALIAWFAVITQYILMIQNREASIVETTIRFFSFFTILTNTLVAIYFTALLFLKNQNFISKTGTLTAITIYITMVGSVYQLILRQVWHPEGLQRIVDELLHTIIPILVIIFWVLYEKTKNIQYSQMLKWTVYPLVYLVFILIRGGFSNFYPYPFVDVTQIGLAKALINSLALVGFFFIISALFIFIGKSIIKRA